MVYRRIHHLQAESFLCLCAIETVGRRRIRLTIFFTKQSALNDSPAQKLLTGRPELLKKKVIITLGVLIRQRLTSGASESGGRQSN
jgi:hypothetical protein